MNIFFKEVKVQIPQFFVFIVEQIDRKTFERAPHDNSVIYIYLRSSLILEDIDKVHDYFKKLENAEIHLPEKEDPLYVDEIDSTFMQLSRRKKLSLYRGGKKLN